MQKFAFFLCLLGFFGWFTLARAQAPAEPGATVLTYTLGMHLDSIPKQNLLKMGKFQKLYRWDRTDEPLKFGDIDVQFIRLFIWDNHLHSIEVKTAEGQGDRMYAWIKSVYGEGKKEDAMGYRYSWYKETMRVLWDHNLGTKEGVVQFVDEATNDKYYRFMYDRQNGGQ